MELEIGLHCDHIETVSKSKLKLSDLSMTFHVVMVHESLAYSSINLYTKTWPKGTA